MASVIIIRPFFFRFDLIFRYYSGTELCKFIQRDLIPLTDKQNTAGYRIPVIVMGQINTFYQIRIFQNGKLKIYCLQGQLQAFFAH